MEGKKIIEVTDVGQVLDELAFSLQEAKNIIEQLNTNTDFIKDIEKLKNFREQIKEFKEILEKLKVENDKNFETMTVVAIKLEEAREVIQNIEKMYTTMRTILEEETQGLKEIILNEYEEMIKKVKKVLYSNIREILKELKIADETLRYYYNKDYIKDVVAINKQQKIIMFLLAIVVAISVASNFYFYKKINFVKDVATANYITLHPRE
jgi:DNA-binding transcriptional MerR regulator